MADPAVMVAFISASALTITTMINTAASLLSAKRSKVAQDQSVVAANASGAAARNSATAVNNTASISNGWSRDVKHSLDDIADTLHTHVNDKQLHHYHRQDDQIMRK